MPRLEWGLHTTEPPVQAHRAARAGARPATGPRARLCPCTEAPPPSLLAHRVPAAPQNRPCRRVRALGPQSSGDHALGARLTSAPSAFLSPPRVCQPEAPPSISRFPGEPLAGGVGGTLEDLL